MGGFIFGYVQIIPALAGSTSRADPWWQPDGSSPLSGGGSTRGVLGEYRLLGSSPLSRGARL